MMSDQPATPEWTKVLEALGKDVKKIKHLPSWVCGAWECSKVQFINGITKRYGTVEGVQEGLEKLFQCSKRKGEDFDAPLYVGCKEYCEKFITYSKVLKMINNGCWQ